MFSERYPDFDLPVGAVCDCRMLSVRARVPALIERRYSVGQMLAATVIVV